MRKLALACASALLIGSLGAPAINAASLPSYVTAALADKSRPAADTDLDSARKPGETIAFAGIRPGDKVADIFPGRGYFSRLFADVVGPKGHVYLWVPDFAKPNPKPADGARAFAANYKNASVITGSINDFSTPEKLDVAWISQNYHDLHDGFMGPADLAKVNKAVFAALKPGGVYLIVDHVAAPGSGLRDTDTLHRIDPAAVKAEVEAAGFKLESTSDILKNPADDHSKGVFDPSIRHHTDQFVFKFRKPRH